MSTITLFVGENGSGKSRQLGKITSHLLRNIESNVISVSNTPFDRFPRVRKPNYFRISPSMGKGYAANVFKKAIASDEDDQLRNSSLIAKTLEYTGFDPIIGLNIKFNNRIDFRDLEERLWKEGELNRENYYQIERAIKIAEIYIGDLRHDQSHTIWIDLYQSKLNYDFREILYLVSFEKILKKLGLVNNVSIKLQKNGFPYSLEAASSGEVSLLASHVFIATHIKDRSYILIDEPENSLHPRWQAEFCKNFMDQFYYFEPKLLIATHSPHVVHGAQMEIGAEVVKLPFNQNTDEPLTNSIEGILFEAFGVLSPASHYLSEKVTYLLNEMTQNRVSFDSVISQLQRLKSISWDAKQKEFLEKAELLTKEVFQANTRVEN